MRVKSLASDEQAAQATDGEGIARFRLSNGDVLVIGIEEVGGHPVESHTGCRAARLPAFAGHSLPRRHAGGPGHHPREALGSLRRGRGG